MPLRVFVAGGSGVLGRASVHALVRAGFSVRSTARGIENSKVIRALGAQPIDIDLYDAKAVRQAVAGSYAVVRLTTKIPPLMKFRRPEAWCETNRLRTIGARILVDAAIAEHVPVYIHESVTFVYPDGGVDWLDEDSPTDDGGAPILRAAIEGEKEAARLWNFGGRGIVLRFGGFYGPDAPSTRETAAMARRRMLFQAGSGANYFSSIYVADAGRAVAAALRVPAGVYNVTDNDPVRFSDYLRILAESVGASRPLHLPGTLGKWMFGDVWNYFSRSQRVSNARFKRLSGWEPVVQSVSQGWPLIAAKWGRLGRASETRHTERAVSA